MSQVKIYECPALFCEIPAGYQAVLISLDGAIKGNLNWKRELEWASICAQQGLSILWEIRLGLFDKLPMPLSHKTQFLSLGLSLEHFLQGPWKEFHAHSLGVCLYRGNADFSLCFPWEDEDRSLFHEWLRDYFKDVEVLNREMQFSVKSFTDVDPKQPEGQLLAALYCRDIAADYFDLLAGHMSQILPLYLLLDASVLTNPAAHIQMLFKERFARFELGVKGSLVGNFPLEWDSNGWTLSLERREKMAICLPDLKEAKPSLCQRLSLAVNTLNQQQIPFRLIFENTMTHEWDELDLLFVLPACLSGEGKRKLMGFCAAGGQIVSLGEHLGLPEEISFQEWSSKF